MNQPVRVYASDENLGREDQLAWKIAEVAADTISVTEEVTEMVINRVIDAPERAGRPDTVELWQKLQTLEDAAWTRRYHSNDPAEKAFGGRVEIVLTDGRTVVDEIAVADAHPLGARSFARADYVAKFETLAADVLDDAEITRFLALTERLPELDSTELRALNIVARPGLLEALPLPKGLF